MPALASQQCSDCFNKITSAPDAESDVPHTAFRRSVTDSRKSLDMFRAQNLLVPFYTDDRVILSALQRIPIPIPRPCRAAQGRSLAEAQRANLQQRTSGQWLYPGPRPRDHRIHRQRTSRASRPCAYLAGRSRLRRTLVREAPDAAPRRRGRGEPATDGSKLQVFRVSLNRHGHTDQARHLSQPYWWRKFP